jgi:hypothetical protein
MAEDGGSYRIIWQFDAAGKPAKAYEHTGNCVISPDLVGMKMDANCGLFAIAEIASDNLGRAGRLKFQMIDHRRSSARRGVRGAIARSGEGEVCPEHCERAEVLVPDSQPPKRLVARQ